MNVRRRMVEGVGTVDRRRLSRKPVSGRAPGARFATIDAMLRLTLFLVAVAVAGAGCSKSSNPAAAHTHGKHEHTAPHGGTPVVLGQEAYHLEVVRDADAGKLSVYVLDGEMEKFIRVPAPALEIVATVGGQPRPLTLKAVANPATGEAVGDTALFETQADWLKTTATFDAVVTKIEIKGTAFTAVAFNFPKGNEAPAHRH
jgi:hypothetical protein